MVRWIGIAIISGIAVILPWKAMSQDESSERRLILPLPDTLQRNFATLGFDKSLTTFHWTGTSLYQNVFGPLSVQMNERYLSTLIDAIPQLITDNQSFDLHLGEQVSDNVSLTTKVSSFVSSDNKGIGISNASSNGFYGGIAFKPVTGLIVEPLIGYRLDNQNGQNDKGASYILNVKTDSVISSDYDANLNGSYQYDKIDPRLLETGNVTGSVEKLFFEQTRNFLGLQYYRNRRDFYSPADSIIHNLYGVLNNIQSRSDNALTLIDTLDYNIGNDALMTFFGSFFTREIDNTTRYNNTNDPNQYIPNTTITENQIEGGTTLHYHVRNNLIGGFTLAYLERDERHVFLQDPALSTFTVTTLSDIESRKNNISKRTTLSFSLALMPSPSDSISISGSGSLLHYDTPSSENDDDRDELYYLANLSAFHRFNQYFRMSISVDLSLMHLVYLFSSESANNTWNRILRLSPRFEYTPFKTFSTVNTFEVLANYTVYDFDYISSSAQSFSFRQFSFVDSTRWNLTQRVSIEWFSNIRLYERGELHWDEFSERPVNSFDETTYIGTIQYAMTERLLFSLGIRYFSQLRYDYNNNNRMLDNVLRSTGPMVAIWFSAGSRTEISFRGWYEHQTQSAQPDHGITTMAMFMNVRI